MPQRLEFRSSQVSVICDWCNLRHHVRRCSAHRCSSSRRWSKSSPLLVLRAPHSRHSRRCGQSCPSVTRLTSTTPRTSRTLPLRRLMCSARCVAPSSLAGPHCHCLSRISFLAGLPAACRRGIVGGGRCRGGRYWRHTGTARRGDCHRKKALLIESALNAPPCMPR